MFTFRTNQIFNLIIIFILNLHQLLYPQFEKNLKRNNKKNWTCMVYIAADNNLNVYAWSTIRQLAKGANENMSILVQLNEAGKQKKTERYIIEKNNAILLNKDNTKKLDSGDPETLIDFCSWVIKNYPAENYMLILSNHGSGIIDIEKHLTRLINPTELFVLNQYNHMLELDRNLSYLDLHEKMESNIDALHRGICFDETFGSYLNNQKLDYALNKICNSENNKKLKFKIIGLDACFMQMIEVGNLLKPYAEILVASEEVELGNGWRYDIVLKPFLNKNLTPLEFAKHIVNAYDQTYSYITNDFTLSAINLNFIDDLEKNISNVANILNECLNAQKDNSIKSIIRNSKKHISFEEPRYIDLASFYENILAQVNKFSYKNNKSNYLSKKLEQELSNGLLILKRIIIENACGKNISYAKGISIYFPEKDIHSTYLKTNFAQTNQWMNLLNNYTNKIN